MSVPSNPSTQGLANCLTTVGKRVNTSKYKFSNWNIKLPKNMTKNPDSEFRKLSRAAQFFREGHYTMEDIKEIQKNARAAKEAEKAAKEASKLAKETSKLAKESKKVIEKTKKVAEESKKVIDIILKKVPGSNTLGKALGASNMLGALAIMGAQAGITAFAAWVSNFVQDTQDKIMDRISADLTTVNGRSIDNRNLIRKQQEQINNLSANIKAKIDKIYAEAAGAAKNATTAKQKANDALYETRANKSKLEAKVAEVKKQANDAFYETRTGRAKTDARIDGIKQQVDSQRKDLDKYLAGVKDGFQQKLQATVTELQKGLTESQTQVKKANESIGIQSKIIQTLQETVKKVQLQASTIDPKIAELKDFTIKLVTGAVNPVEIKVNENNQKLQQIEKKYGVTTNSIEGIERSLRETYNLSFEAQAAKWNEQMRQQDRKIESVTATVNTTTTIGQIREIKNDLDKLKTGNEEIKSDLEKVEKDITKIDNKIKEQEKVNQQALPKLDQILRFLPLIPGRAADAIRPSIPTIPQIETASATGTCRTLQPGGCSRKAFDDLGNGINQNVNNQSNNLLDKLNAGANAAQLGLLKIIDNKLGAQLPGGLSATFGRLWQMLQVDRVLNVLTYIAVVHNALMLSNNIFQTLFSAVNNISEFAGFKWKNEKGDEVGFGGVINEWVGNALKSIFGEETIKNTSKLWNAANRIYQSAANIISAFQSIQQSILTALEVVGAGVARIANALRAAGQVFEKAYEWMNPNPNFDNALFRTLGKLQDTASNIETVSQTPLDIKSSVESMKEEKKQMGLALKDGENALKGLGIIESEKQAELAKKRKEESAGKDLKNIDKVEADD